MDLHRQWQRTWQALRASPAARLFDELIERYSEPHRRYHTLRHLEECLQQFDLLSSSAEHPAEVEAALWFHDAIYDTHRHDNELRSADWAKSVVPPPCGARVHALVMATRHEAVPSGIDEQVLVDVDLSILGAQTGRFDEYEAQIREEYAWVPAFIYRRKRKEVLEGFVARATIFSTACFIERHEERARANIARALAKL